MMYMTKTKNKTDLLKEGSWNRNELR